MRSISSPPAETVSKYDYDVVPFQGTSEPLAHPSRLQMVAALHGLKPAPPKDARVLELGCGTGANLLPLGIEFPNATIVGCDLAATAVAAGHRMAAELGLTNIDFRHASVADVDDSWGEFDYIICHDVFSWVAPELQQKILQIQSRNLAPHGVAYLSHDVLPAWHRHDAVLGMMRAQVRDVTGFRPRIDRARAWLDTAARAPNPPIDGMKEELWVFASIPDEHLFHQISDAPHRAFYAHELEEIVEHAGLKWFADAGPVGNGSFRRALLCQSDAPLRRDDVADVVRNSWIGLARSAIVIAQNDGEMCVSTRANDEKLCSTDRAVCEALQRLRLERPALVPFSELAAPDAVDFFVNAFDVGAIDVVLSPFRVTNHIADAPTVSPLARLEARRGAVVTNAKAEPVRLNDPMRFVVQRLDGQLDVAGLADAINSDRTHAQSAFADWSMTSHEIADQCLRRARDSALLI